MFSAEYYGEIKAAFDRELAFLDERGHRVEEEEGNGSAADMGLEPGLRGRLLLEKKEEILGTLAQCTEEEAQALTFLYSAMPFSDLADYPAALFLAYARHGVFLWNQGSFAGRVPEKLFANYVLHYRVNNEDIADTRGFFFDKLKEAAECGTMYDAAIEANYWCAREATYRATDGRTQNPRTMYGTAIGRCGEESTLAVTVLRSIGIPARQVYAPLWSHCDDNHAWVEAWCDGGWHFLGACEPEQCLDRGWFIGPASRAMLLHSRWFGKDEPEDGKVGPKGMASVLNHLDFYAHTRRLTVRVVDEEGRPVPCAMVNLQVPNHGEFGSIAMIHAGEGPEDCGVARFLTGLGDLYVSACAGKGLYGEAIAVYNGIGQEAECTVVVKDCPECWEGWREFDFHAPELGHIHDETLTQEQQQTGERRLAKAVEYRQKKAAGFYDEREAARVKGRFGGEDGEKLDVFLRQAHSNMGELVRFLEWDAAGLVRSDWPAGRSEHWKLEVLESLREKDCWDIRAEILMDCCVNALPYAGSVPDDIFFRFLLCPRVSKEMLRPCRTALARCLGKDAKELVRREPGRLPKMVDKWIVSMPEQEYEELITSPLGCLRGGIGSRHSKDIFCVNLYRSLGIPARLNFFDGRIEYYRNGWFTAGDGQEDSCRLVLQESEVLKLEEWEHYSLERFEGDGFRRLGLWGRLDKENGEVCLDVRSGVYRIVTLNRQKNGNQLARVSVFALQEGERRRVTLSMREIPLEGMLIQAEIKDFALQSHEGTKAMLSELAKGGKALFLWLEVTREPTEHILNELYERKEDFGRLDVPLHVILRTPEDLEDDTLHRTMEALPMLRPLYHDFGGEYEALAKSVGQEPGKLPLAVILDGGPKCIYSDAGYNVGLADILWRILS